MTLGDLLSAISELIVGDGVSPGLLGDDFALFIAVGVVASLAVTQLPKLAKRLR